MEKKLNKLFSKHLIYIIQEYSREEYTFLKELKNSTQWLKIECDRYYFYDNMTRNLLYNNRILKYKSQIYYSVHTRWDVKFIYRHE
jgi:hypothetical protein